MSGKAWKRLRTKCTISAKAKTHSGQYFSALDGDFFVLRLQLWEPGLLSVVM